ncbi:MAG: tetratricopeptide repeat protein [Haliscomenobacter sp.]|nr:tetratricopeptide repeat protein [Haliscomenobacter sp.]MBP9075865.1 tetratricopeptide repeat protein [Haliscomenobacter sp.]
MLSRSILFLLFLFLGSAAIQGQQTSVYTDAQKAFKQGLQFYENGLLAKAKREFQKTTDLLLPVNEAEAGMLRTQAQLYQAKCAVQLELKDGEATTLNFIRSMRPDPEYQQALVDMGDFYFNNRRYEEALDYYAEIPASGLPRDQMAQVRFRQGYAHFAKKEYTAAKSYLKDISADAESEYHAPSNYYLGLCYFYEGDYNQAYRAFSVVEKVPEYKNELPYIQAQILFAQRKFDEVIAKAGPLTNDPRANNLKEIRQIVGQAYFEKGDYKNALPHLEYYASRSSKLREEELYQVGFAQYQEKKYQEAIRNLKPLSTANSPIGQNAMFYLANCYLQLGDKNNALAALGTAKRLTYDPVLQEDALFNHAKLAYELNLPREAANDLQEIQPNSRYYGQAQQLLSEVLLGYRDYQQALTIIEEMMKTNRTPQLALTYQKVALNRGIQLLQNNDPAGARPFFQKAVDNPADPKLQAVGLFWLGDVANRLEQYQESMQYIDRFLTASRSLSELPDEANTITASYLQGYNHLKTNSYDRARSFFQATVDGIARNRRFITNTQITNELLGDATMRLGDAYFRINQYNSAAQYYDEVISKRYAGYDYAIFQKAIIEGLRGRKTEEIIALERLEKEFPNSEYTDDALLRLGMTYQEIGKLSQAIDPLRTLTTKYRNKSPLVNQALLQLGLIAYNMGNYEGAINYYKQVFTNNPEPAEASQALAALEEIYIKDLGRPGDYTAFLETVPGYKVDNYVRDSITYKTAQIQFENADYQRAAESFSSYIRSFPKGLNIIPAYYNRGECYSVLRQYTQALKDYEAVIQQGASRFFVKALEKAAIIAYNHELDFEKSLKFYTELEKNATSEDMLFEAQLGALRSAYRTKNSASVYSYAAKVNNNPRANNAQIATANFYLGKLAFDNQDFNNALSGFQKVVQLSDNEQTAEARYLIAYIYYQRRDLNKAQELCLKANQESSAYPYWVANSVLLLADVMAEKGDLYNARAVLEALLENYNEDQELVNKAKTRLGQINRQIEQSSILNKSGGSENRD